MGYTDANFTVRRRRHLTCRQDAPVRAAKIGDFGRWVLQMSTGNMSSKTGGNWEARFSENLPDLAAS